METSGPTVERTHAAIPAPPPVPFDPAAEGALSDPALGDPRFVSSARIDAAPNRLSWFSTTPYLSALLAGQAQRRLVVDPLGNYFWLTCATATRNFEAPRVTSKHSRDLIRVYSCLHR